MMAPALPTTVGLHVGTLHNKPGLNGANPGAYLRTDRGATLGAYHNSLGRQSVYAAWSFDYRVARYVIVTGTVGAVSGYDSRALVVPGIAFGDKRRIRLSLLLPAQRGAAGGLHLSIEGD
jgi:hypothetical protein